MHKCPATDYILLQHEHKLSINTPWNFDFGVDYGCWFGGFRFGILNLHFDMDLGWGLDPCFVSTFTRNLHLSFEF